MSPLSLGEMFPQWGWHTGPGTMGWGMMGWLGPILMVAFWVAVIVGVVLLIRWLVVSSKPPRAEDSALEILKRRYAMGEISKEEYEEKKRDLLL